MDDRKDCLQIWLHNQPEWLPDKTIKNIYM